MYLDELLYLVQHMYIIEERGQEVSVNEHAFYKHLRRLAEWLELNAERQYRSQQQGFPDLRRTWKPFFETMARDSKLVAQIQDRELQALFLVLFQQTKTFLTDVDDLFVDVTAKRVGVPFPQTQRQRNRLAREIVDLMYSGMGMPGYAPYIALFSQAEAALDEIRATRKRIDEKLVEHPSHIT